ncbi:MAG: nucleotidyltransferase family protein [Phycisphaerales bacterium]|nr:nucleotidyltransferase family protein [Phycisphaerales bacterium]
MSIGGYDSAALLQRMVDAVEQVRQRLVRAAAALKNAGVEYAVVGGNAVAAWVATVDQAAVRNTQDVDIMIRRGDFDRAKAALEAAGFVHRRARNLDLFLDDANAGPRQAVHLVFAGEFVKPGEPAANPDVAESTDVGGHLAIRILNLDALVRIKLTAFRDKDRTHLRDLIEVGLVDQSWTTKMPATLAQRLQSILDNPDG